MKHRSLYIIMSLLLVLSVCSVPAFATEGLPLGQPLDDFSVTCISGETFTLSEALAEKDLVLINLWATWCGPCQAEFPYLEEAYEQYQDRVEVIALSVEPEDTEEALTAFAEEYGLTFPIANEGGLGLADTFVTEGIPTTLAVDRFGNVAFLEVGSQSSAGAFTRVFDYFLSEDYTETKVLDGTPAATPDVPNPEPEEIAAALGAGDSGIVFRFADNAGYWPMVPAEKDGRTVLVNSNAGVEETSAALYADITAAEGDVLAFDIACSTLPVWNALVVSVDGKNVKAFSGEREFAGWAIPLEEGEHEIAFLYEPWDYPADDEDSVWLADMRVLSGQEAEDALAALPVYPSGEEFGITIRNEDAREIVWDDEYAGYLKDMYGADRSYLIPGGEATAEAVITADMDAESAFFYCDYDVFSEPVLLTDALTEDSAYLLTTPVDDYEETGFPYTGLYVYRMLQTEGPEDWCGALLFRDEENLDAFIADAAEYDGIELTWHYADEEGAPAAEPEADPAGEPEAAADSVTYEVTFTDQNGDPVPGCVINFCTDESCQPVRSDENGLAVFTGEPYAYHLQVIKVPEGYDFDTTQEFTADETGGEIGFTVPKQ